MPLEQFLTLLQHARLLLQEEPCVLASQEDATYFRNKYEKQGAANRPAISSPKSEKGGEGKPPLNHIASKGALPSLPHPAVKEKPLPEEKPKEALEKPIPLQREIPPSPLKEIADFPKEKGDFSSNRVEAIGKESSLGTQDAVGMKTFRLILEKIAPSVKIFDTIPSDALAKQIANRWKTKNQSAPISILSSGELPQHKALLKEIATALDVYFGPARIIDADPIEKEKQWKLFLSSEGLKRIVICDSTLWQLVSLRQFYKETPGTEIRMLETVPVFLLPDLSLYLKDPQLKRFLWKALCSKCS